MLSPRACARVIAIALGGAPRAITLLPLPVTALAESKSHPDDWVKAAKDNQGNIYKVVAIALLLLPLSILAQSKYHPHTWEQVAKDNQGNIYKLDLRVVGRRQVRVRQYWMQVMLSKVDKQGYKWKKTLNTIDCQTFRRQLQETVYYDGKGEIQHISDTRNNPPTGIIPQKSIEGKVATRACSLK